MGLFPKGYDTCGREPSQTPGGRRTSKADPCLDWPIDTKWQHPGTSGPASTAWRHGDS